MQACVGALEIRQLHSDHLSRIFLSVSGGTNKKKATNVSIHIYKYNYNNACALSALRKINYVLQDARSAGVARFDACARGDDVFVFVPSHLALRAPPAAAECPRNLF